MHYRPDIDGLRAIAVLAVIVFHARDSLLPGGFVGVDIFFVISGYLISKQIAAEMLANKFSLLEFYRRRIRRIMPMMLVVVAVTLTVAVLIMTPEDGRAVAKSAVWSVASLANVHFWRDLDQSYFAASSAEIPLLHLWSLGIEEQFYLIWPLLLMLLIHRLRLVVLMGGMAVAAAASFQLAWDLLPRDAPFSYYMLPTRAGELLLGALVGIPAASDRWRLGPRTAVTLAVIGTLAILISLIALDRYEPFPGWLALQPTLGAALLILAGERRPNPIRMLAATPLTYIGKISYSAYLWHWPMFALFRYSYGEPGWLACLVIIGLTLLLAAASYRLVEQPTRSTNRPFMSVARRQFVLPALVIVLPAMAIIYAPRLELPLASDHYLAELESVRATIQPLHAQAGICQRRQLTIEDMTNDDCVSGSKTSLPPRTLVWGDSNAAHFVPMVGEIARHLGVSARNFAVDACPPLFGDPQLYVDARRARDCASSAQLASQQIGQYPVLIISAAWTLYQARHAGFIDDFETTLRELTGRQHVVVLIGKAPILKHYNPRCAERALRVPLLACRHAPEPLDPQVTRFNARLRELAAAIPRVHFFDPNPHLCPQGVCELMLASGVPRYLDSTHLTIAGSADLGRTIIAATGVPAAFSAMAAPTEH